MIKKKNI